MAEIIITGGSHPKQQAALNGGKIILKDANRKVLSYLARAAVTELETVSESWGKRMFRMSLRDGHVIVCSARTKTFEILYQEMVTGPKEGDVIVKPETTAEKATRNLIRYSSGIAMILMMGYCSIKNMDNDPNRIPYAERRTIENTYYATSSNPNLPEAFRKRYKCSESQKLADYYRSRGDEKSEREWKNINARECRD